MKEVIIFESGFADKLEKDKQAGIQVIADASDPNTANLLVGYTSGIIAGYQQEYMNNTALPVSITTESQMMYNPDMKSVFMFVPGVITVLLMLITAMMTSISIAREKEMGTMEILLVSPLRLCCQPICYRDLIFLSKTCHYPCRFSAILCLLAGLSLS